MFFFFVSLYLRITTWLFLRFSLSHLFPQKNWLLLSTFIRWFLLLRLSPSQVFSNPAHTPPQKKASRQNSQFLFCLFDVLPLWVFVSSVLNSFVGFSWRKTILAFFSTSFLIVLPLVVLIFAWGFALFWGSVLMSYHVFGCWSCVKFRGQSGRREYWGNSGEAR